MRSYETSNVTGRHRGPKRKRLQSAVTTTDVTYVIRCYRRVWYRALSLRYACIRSSGIILISWATCVPNFVSFAAPIAELAHG